MEEVIEFLRWPVAIGCGLLSGAFAIANLSILVLRLRGKPIPSRIPVMGFLMGMAAMYTSPVPPPSLVFVGVMIVLCVAELGWAVPG